MAKQGEVHLQMLPGEVILRPTPHALRTVLTELGGARQVYGALYNMEYSAIFGLLKAGTKRSDQEVWGREDDKALDEAIFAYGLSDLVEPCTRYLTLLINGGREPKEEDGSSGEG